MCTFRLETYEKKTKEEVQIITGLGKDVYASYMEFGSKLAALVAAGTFIYLMFLPCSQ